MEFDHHLNLVVTFSPTDRPYADAILAAGFQCFPHYCATYLHRQRVFAFVVFHATVFHVEHVLQCFIAAGYPPALAPRHFGGVPLLYARDDSPPQLAIRLRQLCPY